MTHVLLFCTAEEAKPFVWEVMSVKAPGQKADDPGVFYLVESNVLFTDRDRYKNRLQEGDTFESDFIGATLEDCQKWALENQYRVRFIEGDIIVVVDSRSAQDKTVWVSHYETPQKCSGWIFPGFGALPRKFDTWYNYRVKYSYAPLLEVNFNYANPDLYYPAYFGRKEDFTDEQGVFDVAAAERFRFEYNPKNFGTAQL